MEYNPGGSVERVRNELIKAGAIKTPPETTPPTAPGVTTLPPVAPVDPTSTPEASGVTPQPGATVGQTTPPAPVDKPKTGEMVQGETGPNGESLFYVMHDGIESKLTVTELTADHSYKAHNTRIGQENADKGRDLDLRETQLLARETAIAVSGAASFDALLNGAPGTAANAAPEPVVAPVVVPPMPLLEMATENPEEYTRQVTARDAALAEQTKALIASSVQSSVQSAVEPLTTQLAESAKVQEEVTKQADMKTRMDAKMVDLQARIPALDMNAINAFLARSSHEDVERWNHPDGYELVHGKILRGEQPGGVTPAAPLAPPAAVVPGYATPEPTAYPATTPAPNPPYAESGSGGGRVTHANPASADGAPLPNMTTPDAIAQALRNQRATTGATVYHPHQVVR